jgi:thiamine biosynthesis lipoprotein
MKPPGAHAIRPPLVAEGETMGTVWRLVLARPRAFARALRAAVEARLAALVAQMSHWEPASDLCRFNRARRHMAALPPISPA